MASRVQSVLRSLDRDQQLAGLFSIALLITLFLPWYQKSVAVGNAGLDSQNLSAFGVFSFVEAAVLLVAAGVFALLFARGERRAFHLPGGDGTVILGAGAWAAVLLLWRVFDRPDVEGVGATVGITWGFFFAFLAAAGIAAAGWRIRQAGRPEPHNPAAEAGPVAPRRERERRPVVRDAAEAPTRRAPVTWDDAEQPTLWADDEPTRQVPAAPQRRPRPRPPVEPGEIPPAPDRG